MAGFYLIFGKSENSSTIKTNYKSLKTHYLAQEDEIKSDDVFRLTLIVTS